MIHTGEYPPQQGGVADYSGQLARGLADAGDNVTVFAPLPRVHSKSSGRLTVEALPHLLNPLFQRHIARRLDSLPERARILSQYVPHALGAKGVNMPVANTLSRQGNHPVDIMFHEVAYPYSADGKLRHRFLARTQARMARAVASRADRIFVAAMGWQTLLEKLLGRPVSTQWLPVPSNLPLKAQASSVADVRKRYAPAGETIIGHFSTHSNDIHDYLREAIPRLLGADARRVFLLVGRRAEESFRSLSGLSREVMQRTVAVRGSDQDNVVAHLAACDLVIQPFPDGVSGRRGTAMAPLALGVPVLTTSGPMTESLWENSDAVALSPAANSKDFSARAEQLLANRSACEALGRRGAELYRAHFALEHTIKTLRRVE